jgi:hypothetical protein
MIGAYINIKKKSWLEYFVIYLMACGIGANIAAILYFIGIIN